ncbi:MAG: hypothetical protein RLZZ16_949, partial [Actinomycetota bacterium]
PSDDSTHQSKFADGLDPALDTTVVQQEALTACQRPQATVAMENLETQRREFENCA